MNHQTHSHSVFQGFLTALEGLSTNDNGLKDLFFEAIKPLSSWELLPTYMGLRAQLRSAGRDPWLSLLDSWEGKLYSELLDITPALTEEEKALEKARILVASTEHPEVKEFHDSDIPDYFFKREKQDMSGAREVYARLSKKYPGHEDRLNLMRWARTSHPLFAPWFRHLRNALADTYILGIRKTILYVLACFSESGGHSALDLFSKVRMAVKILPGDKRRAVALLERLQTYADSLDFHAQAFGSVCEILEDYYGESLFTKKQVKLVLPQEVTGDSDRPKTLVQTFDVTKVTFSPEDLAAILINPKITGTENITLTFCWQYWLRTKDPEFENKVYLYSLKHQSHHSAIFQVIKRGQDLGSKDNDILHAVYNIVGKDTTYEYNVRKDIYMQTLWLRIKPGQSGPVIKDKRAWAEEQIRLAKERKARTLLAAAEKSAQQKAEREQAKLRAMDQVKRMKERDQQLRRLAEAKVQAQKEAKEQSKARAYEKAGAERAKEKAAIYKPLLEKEKDLSDEWKAYDGEEKKVVPLLQRISEIDHTEQKNLHLVFRRRMEGEIFAYLDEFIWDNRLEIKSVQKTLAAMAIKDFIFAHLDRDVRNWTMSNERLKVKEQGLPINDIEPILERCLGHLPQGEKV